MHMLCFLFPLARFIIRPEDEIETPLLSSLNETKQQNKEACHVSLSDD